MLCLPRRLSQKCHANRGKSLQFANKRRKREEKAACSDLLQLANFLRLAQALARFCKSGFLATNQKVGSSNLSGRATFLLFRLRAAAFANLLGSGPTAKRVALKTCETLDISLRTKMGRRRLPIAPAARATKTFACMLLLSSVQS